MVRDTYPHFYTGRSIRLIVCSIFILTFTTILKNSRIFDRKAGVNEPWVIQKSTPRGFELTVFIRLPDDNGTQLHAE